MNIIGYWGWKNDCGCNKEKKNCDNYSYKKYYVKKCHCECCLEPYYQKDQDHKSDDNYNYKKGYSNDDHQKGYYDYYKCDDDYGHKEDY